MQAVKCPHKRILQSVIGVTGQRQLKPFPPACWTSDMASGFWNVTFLKCQWCPLSLRGLRPRQTQRCAADPVSLLQLPPPQDCPQSPAMWRSTSCQHWEGTPSLLPQWLARTIILTWVGVASHFSIKPRSRGVSGHQNEPS